MEHESTDIDEELETLQALAFKLVQDLATWPVTQDITPLQERAKALALIMAERGRDDRCYRCGNREKQELSDARITSPCICTDCQMQDYRAARKQLYHSWENR